jgi:putative ABC transport system substrate-binding protein
MVASHDRRPGRSRWPRVGICLALLLAAGTAIPVAAEGIVVVKSNDQASYKVVVESLEEVCRNVTAQPLRRYSLQGDKGKWKAVAAELRADEPRLVVALGPLAANLVREQFGQLPLLYCMVPNPQRYQLVGDNVAGISLDVPGEVQFATYKQVLPTLRTIGVIYDPNKSGALVEQAIRDAEKLGLELIAVPVTSHKKVPGALRDMLGRIDALWTVPDDTVLTTDSFRFLLITSLERKLPFLAMSEIFVKVGALATIAPVPTDLARQLCQLIDRHQSGELNLAEIDVLPPETSQLVINRKTAEKIGLSLPPAVLESAGTVY